MEWNPQIHRESAREDGLKPSDFNWLDYPCSNVRLDYKKEDEYLPSPILYRCEVPSDTPQLNFYVEEPVNSGNWKKIPDPVGESALSWIEFHLIDEDTGDRIDKNQIPNHNDGVVVGFPNDSSELWKKLLPNTSLNVRLVVFGLFFPYMKKDGDGSNYLSTVNRGYLNTPVSYHIETEVCKLSMRPLLNSSFNADQYFR